jgi:hypothetical protein
MGSREKGADYGLPRPALSSPGGGRAAMKKPRAFARGRSEENHFNQ